MNIIQKIKNLMYTTIYTIYKIRARTPKVLTMIYHDNGEFEFIQIKNKDMLSKYKKVETLKRKCDDEARNLSVDRLKKLAGI